jgi:hypothetical protein
MGYVAIGIGIVVSCAIGVVLLTDESQRRFALTWVIGLVVPNNAATTSTENIQ